MERGRRVADVSSMKVVALHSHNVQRLTPHTSFWDYDTTDTQPDSADKLLLSTTVVLFHLLLDRI